MFLKCSHLAMVDICDYILIYSMAYAFLHASNHSLWAWLTGRSLEAFEVHGEISMGCEVCNSWFDSTRSCFGKNLLSIMIKFSELFIKGNFSPLS